VSTINQHQTVTATTTTPPKQSGVVGALHLTGDVPAPPVITAVKYYSNEDTGGTYPIYTYSDGTTTKVEKMEDGQIRESHTRRDGGANITFHKPGEYKYPVIQPNVTVKESAPASQSVAPQPLSQEELREARLKHFAPKVAEKSAETGLASPGGEAMQAPAKEGAEPKSLLEELLLLLKKLSPFLADDQSNDSIDGIPKVPPGFTGTIRMPVQTDGKKPPDLADAIVDFAVNRAKIFAGEVQQDFSKGMEQIKGDYQGRLADKYLKKYQKYPGDAKKNQANYDYLSDPVKEIINFKLADAFLSDKPLYSAIDVTQWNGTTAEARTKYLEDLPKGAQDGVEKRLAERFEMNMHAHCWDVGKEGKESEIMQAKDSFQKEYDSFDDSMKGKVKEEVAERAKYLSGNPEWVSKYLDVMPADLKPVVSEQIAKHIAGLERGQVRGSYWNNKVTDYMNLLPADAQKGVQDALQQKVDVKQAELGKEQQAEPNTWPPGVKKEVDKVKADLSNTYNEKSTGEPGSGNRSQQSERKSYNDKSSKNSSSSNSVSNAANVVSQNSIVKGPQKPDPSVARG
jgi:hypothetical protein